MALEKFELNTEGVGQLLRSEEVQQMLLEEAQKRCPDGCRARVFAGTKRANARITAVTKKAIKDNLENNTLLGAISQ